MFNRLKNSVVILVITSCLTMTTNIMAVNSTGLDLAKEQVFKRGNYDEPDTLDPQKAFAAPDYNILADLYEGLTTFDKDGNVILGQAKSYSVSKDKKTYIFTLKDNLKWSNGDYLTAYDFEYGIKRVFDHDVASQNYILLKDIKNSEQVLSGRLGHDSLGIKALDQTTLKIELSKPIPYLLSLLTHNSFAPVYKPNVIKYGDKFTNPEVYVTNGAFKLQEWVVNSHLSLVKNYHYHAANEVLLDKVVFYPVNQQSYELNRYRAGDIDYTAKVPAEHLSWIKQKFPAEIYATPMLAAYYYTFNVTRQPFKDNINLRKALAYSIDKNIIANKILGGDRAAAERFVPSSTSNYQVGNNEKTDSDFYVKQIELAHFYYNKAGYSKSNPLKTKLLFHTNESNKIIATAVASMWRKNLGIQTELVNQEWKVFLKTRLEHKDTEVLREGWIASYDDPTAFLDLFSSNNPQNSSGYNNEDYDKLLLKASMEGNTSKRARILQKAEDILLNDAPVVPIYTPTSYHLVKPYVGGLNINRFDVTKDQYIYINKH